MKPFMAKKTPKRKATDPDQLRRFIERAEEIGATASEEEFEKAFRKALSKPIPKPDK
jgi:hypothetical protein